MYNCRDCGETLDEIDLELWINEEEPEDNLVCETCELENRVQGQFETK